LGDAEARPTCHSGEFGRCMTNHAGVHRGSKNKANFGVLTCDWGHADPQTHATPPLVIMPNLVTQGQMVHG